MNNELIDCGFRGGGERYSDRRERSGGRGPGIPFWQTQVSDSALKKQNSKLGFVPGTAAAFFFLCSSAVSSPQSTDKLT